MAAASVELSVVLGSTASAYKFGMWYFAEGLFPERDIASSTAAFGGHRKALSLTASGRAFAATFSLAIWILELIVFEVASIMRPATRALCWRVSLSLMAFNVHAVLPFLLAFAAISHRFGVGRGAAAGAAVAMLLFAALSWFLEENLQIAGSISSANAAAAAAAAGSESPHRILTEIEQHFFSLEALLARIGVVGIASLAVLSGFGAVSFPLQQLSVLLAKVTPAGLERRETQLRQTLGLIGQQRRRRALASAANGGGGSGGGRARNGHAPVRYSGSRSLQANASNGASNSSVGNDGFTGVITENGSAAEGGSSAARWLSRWAGFGAESESAVALAGLEQLSQELFQEIVEERAALAAQREARTPRGKALLALGLFMLVYCVFKMFGAARNVLMGPSRVGDDPVTAWMSYLLARWGLLGHVDLRAWSTAASFVLIGVLVVLQVRGFLLTIQQVSRSRSVSGAAIPAQVLALLLSLLMGIYMTSSVLLLRANLPQKHRLAIRHALGDIRFSFFSRWFDSIFLLSALLVALMLATGQIRLKVLHNSGIAPDAPPAEDVRRE